MKKRSIKVFSLLIAVLLCAFYLVSCSSNPSPDAAGGETAVLTLWGAADDQKMLSEMVEEFKKANPDKTYNITLRVVGDDVAKDEVLKDAGASADVFSVPHDQLGALVEAGAVYENTKYAEEFINTTIEGALQTAYFGGKMYGYPCSANTYFLYYDKRIFTEDDVSSLEKILSKTVDSGISKMGYDMGNAYYTGPMFFTNGGSLFGEKGDDKDIVTFNDANGKEVASYIATLKQSGIVSITEDVAVTQFRAGKLGAHVTGAWKSVAIKEALGENMGVAKLPTVKYGTKDMQMKSFSGIKLYLVKATTKYPLEAMALAAFLTNKENQLKRFTDTNQPPTHKELVNDPVVLEDTVVNALSKQLPFAVPMPAISQMSKFWAPMGAFTKDMYDGVITADDIQAKLDKLVADIKS